MNTWSKVLSLLCVFGAGALPAQVAPAGADWETVGTMEFRFDSARLPEPVNEKTLQVFQHARQLPGSVSYDPRAAVAIFRPSVPLDSRYPFTWELAPGLASHLPLGPQWIAAPCDVPAGTDDDLDGLPDCQERKGFFHDGVPLYAYGARRGQTDLFIEIDYMTHWDKPWITPTRKALERVRQAFDLRGYKVHFDAGDLFGDVYLDPDGFNLGGGNEVPFADAVEWAIPELNCVGGWKRFEPGNMLTEYRAKHFTKNRARSFYYILFANMVFDGNTNTLSVSGRALRSSTNAVVTFGHPGWGTVFTDNGEENEITEEMKGNQIINYQAGTLMHEFGHLLGLKEGGFDDVERKPNYHSVMNYPYQILGLPSIGHEMEGDRFHVDTKTKCMESMLTKVDLLNGPYGNPDDFIIDYSDGLNGDLDENQLMETAGLGRDGESAWVDWDCDGQVDVQPVAKDINATSGTKTVLEDFNDWGNIVLYHRKWFTSGQPWPNAGLAFSCPFP